MKLSSKIYPRLFNAVNFLAAGAISVLLTLAASPVFSSSFTEAVTLSKLAETQDNKITRNKMYRQAGILFGKEFLQNRNFDAAFSAAVVFYKGEDYRSSLRYIHSYLSRNPADADALNLIDQIRNKNGNLSNTPLLNQKRLLDYLLFRNMPFYIFWLFVIVCTSLFLCAVIWFYFKKPSRLRNFYTPAYILIAFIILFVAGRVSYTVPFDGITAGADILLKEQPAFSANNLDTGNYFTAGNILDFKIDKMEREWIRIIFPDKKNGWVHSSSVEIFR